MTLNEYLKMEFDKFPADPLWAYDVIDVATRWHKEELAKMVPSEENIYRLVQYVCCDWENNEVECTTKSKKTQSKALVDMLATALHKFLEERMK